MALVLTIVFLSYGAPKTHALINPFDDRTTQEQIADTGTLGRILDVLKQRNNSLSTNVNVDVWQGRVLLTGLVGDPKDRDFIVKKVRETKGVKVLYNNIRIGVTGFKARKISVKPKIREKEAVSDLWIGNQIKIRLISEKASVKTANYRFRVVLGHAYVIGISRSAKEKADALKVIRETSSVTAVTEYIKVVKIK